MRRLLALLVLTAACAESSLDDDFSGDGGATPGRDATGAVGDGAAPGDGGVRDGQRADADLAPDGSSGGDAEGADAVADAEGADAGPPPPCLLAEGRAEMDEGTLEDGVDRVTVRAAGGPCARSYTLSTTAPLRDGQPENPRRVDEQPDRPYVRTRNVLFDALYALALDEVAQNGVDRIQDHAFNDGAPIPCPPGGCFETGRLWKYVWTRDTAYAVHLGLAALDPVRSRNSLEFKLSERRGGGDLQIVQDTGSGGSYPVSSDRVVWAVGAMEVLKYLAGPAREGFAARVYEALRNTAEHDRAVVYDPQDGLYRGEQSFLDWREQTYPEWTAADTVHIAMSKALSTNVGHLFLLESAAALAGERGEGAAAARYQGWADGLRAAIRDRLWLPEHGLFSTYATTGLDPAATRRFDLLGSALAILLDAATPAQAEEIVARYPHLAHGAPVAWPQQQLTPIYHNRALWPFVTAYWLRAARKAGNDAAADLAVRSLMRGAALNLSNMENLEMVSGAPWLEDGEYSGPVVNSQRQLWSVAGYVAMVHDVVFGVEATPEGLRFAPFVTRWMRDTLFADADTLVLAGFPYHGGRLDVVVHLPPPGMGGDGPLAVGEVRLDGAPLAAGFAPAAALAGAGRVDVHLVPGDAPPAGVTLVDAVGEYRALYGPRTPRITALTAEGGRLRLGLDRGGEAAGDVRFAIYRDGARVADDLPGDTAAWVDADASPAGPGHCYAVETRFAASGNASQHSPPVCWWGPGQERIQTLTARDFQSSGGRGVENHGRFHFEGWGDRDHTLTATFHARSTGPHLVQATYGNGAGGLTTGVTCAVKRVEVRAVADGALAGAGYLVMPHLGDWARWTGSSFVGAELVAGQAYRIVVGEDEKSVNMSELDHFSRYTGGLGGREGRFNHVNIAELKVLSLAP